MSEILKRMQEEEQRRLKEAEDKKKADLLRAEQMKREEEQRVRTQEDFFKKQIAERKKNIEPATKSIVAIFEELKIHPKISSAPKKEVKVEIDNLWQQAKITLMWGEKFGLTDAERSLVEEYRTKRRQFGSYPSEILQSAYDFLWAEVTTRYVQIQGGGYGRTLNTQDFIQDNHLIVPILTSLFSIPSTPGLYLTHILYRKYNYESGPPSPPTSLGY
mgnify:CR=1 FL=1